MRGASAISLLSCAAVRLWISRRCGGNSGTSALSFASEDRLKRFLGLEKRGRDALWES